MLVFCHLFIGAVIGLLLFHWTGRRWLVAACAIGALIPDIIDKPLGHLFLQGSLDFGRIYAHTLLFLAIVLIVGLALWKKRSSLVVLGVAAGMASHLVLDTMWDIPVTTFYPLLGPFEAHHFPDYFTVSLVTEITSISEWLFAISFSIIVLNVYRQELGEGFERLTRSLTVLLKPCLGGLVVVGIYNIAVATVSGETWLDVEADMVLGLSALIGAATIIWLDRKLRAGNKSLF